MSMDSLGLKIDPLELVARCEADSIRIIRLLLPAVFNVRRGSGSEAADL